MLFYLRVIAGGQKTLSVNLQPTDDVSKIREFLAVREPDLIVQNVLFAGRVLQDNTPLSQYDIHKECTVQVMGRRRPNAGEEAKAAAAAAPKAGGALAPPGPLVRQVTAEPLQYGDALIVNVLEARNLMAMDYWSGKSDPYVILTVGKGSAQTSVISKELNPKWNETFGFLIDAPSSTRNAKPVTLSVMVWDHDYLSPDDPLGSVEIPLAEIPRDGDAHHEAEADKPAAAAEGKGDAAAAPAAARKAAPKDTSKWYKLENAKTGEIRLQIRRAALSSPHLRDILQKMEKHPTKWTRELLAANKVTLANFLGEEPFTLQSAKDAARQQQQQQQQQKQGAPLTLLNAALHLNPALAHLEQLVRTSTLRIHNNRTVAKVANILWSQGGVFTQDLPSRYLWFCNVVIDELRFFQLLQEVSGGALKALQYFPNLPRKAHPACASAVAIFKSCEAALLTLLSLQNRVLAAAGEDDEVSRDEFVVLDSARVGGGDEEQKGGRASPASTSRSSRGSSSAAAAGGSAAAPSGSPSLGARPSPSPPPAGSPRLRASPAADAASAPAPAPRRGGVSPVNVLLYAAEDATHLPLHCGFGDTWLTDEAGNAMHPFAGAARVGVVMVAGPYPTADEKSKDTGQGHHTGEWGRFLLVLSASGVLEGYTRIQAFPKPGPQFRYQLGDGSCLVLTCGPWSLELVDGRNRLSYYVKMHTTEGLQDWKELFLRAKQRQLAAPPVAGNVLECGACGRVQPISCFYLCDVQDGVKTAPTCLTCLKARVREAIDAATTAPTDVASDRAQEVLARYSLQDLKDLGSHEQFGEFLDSCTQSYINRRAQKNQFVRCPKCQVAFEVDLHTWATKQSNLTKDAGLDNRPLSKEAQEHFVKNRFRCTSDACGANFCKSCNAQPYHLGFTCEEYKEYKVSPKCRFCHVAVMKRHQIKVVLAETLKEVCDSEECRAKAELSCRARLPCGHPCGGIINEKEHLPCLFPECITAAADAAKAAAAAAKAKRDAAVKADEKRDGAVVEAERQEIEALERKAQRLSQLPPRDDNCSICFESELGTAPSIMLSCGHVLHYTCARQRLEKRWPGVRISWKFAQCALCNVWVDHPSLADLLSPLERMREKLLDKMENRLEIDADEDEDYKERVLNAESAFYKQPIAWAMKTYAFYECHECKQPYFGGKRNCEDNAAEEKNNAEELICHECSKIMSANGCQKPDHQEYLLFKCRFCCSPAVWFCFGNTHFCEYCHSHWPPNRHPANEKCPNNEGKCPLGLPVGSHKNGADADCEFVIGCGMCRNQVKESALNVEVAREKKEVDRSKYRAERIAMFGEPKFPVAAPPPAPAPAPGNVPPAPPVPGGVPDRVDGLRRIVERARNRLTAQEVNQLMEIIRVDFNELQRKLERDLGEDGQAGDAAAAAAAAAGSDSGESDDEAKAAQARPAAAAAPPPPPVLQVAPAPAANAEPEGWNCGACTFLNHAELNECEVCGTAAPADKKRVFREQPQQPLPPGVPPAPPVPQGDFVVLLRKEARRRMRRQKGALRQVMEDLLKEVRRQNVNPAFDAEAPVQVLMRLAAERDEAADPVQRRMLNQAAPADVRGLKSCADAVRAKVCTFAVTRRNYQAQWIYRCHTCNLVGNYGVCESCKDACHKGHRLSKREFAQAFYCDCGPGEVKPNLCKCMP